jgi:hypothetical protein
VIAKVSWSVPTPGVKTVKIFVVGKDNVEVPFTSGEAAGSADTGAWVVASTAFVLRDGDSMKLLAKFLVGSKSCN